MHQSDIHHLYPCLMASCQHIVMALKFDEHTLALAPPLPFPEHPCHARHRDVGALLREAERDAPS
jgi:hypothetical protein